ncbi:MAG: TetR/AcrR family transcriptional regulator [Bdellovibrionota bacterium]
MKKQRDRDETFWKVLNAALDLDFKKGHLKWTMSELSRRSAITRSLIYYHFGRSKQAILDQAVQVIGEQLIGTTPDRMALLAQGDFKESIMQSRELCERSPSLYSFYLMHRDRETEVGARIRKLEGDYRKKLEKLFPQLSATALLSVYAFFYGVAFAPGMNGDAITHSLRALKALTGTANAQ